MIKTFLLSICAVVLTTLVVLALSLLCEVAIHHTTQYVRAYENVTKAEQFQKAEEFSVRILDVADQATRDRKAKEKELEALKKVADDLYTRLNNKEAAIAEYCQATQDLSRVNAVLVRKLNNVSALAYSLIKQLPEDDRKNAYRSYMEILSEGGRTE